MKRKLIFTACLLALCLFQSYAQCDDPAPPGLSCPTATAFCNGEIDGYCSATYNSGVGTNVDMPPFCGSVQNNQWIQFVAGTTTINLEFTVDNCTNGDGLQAMILHTDDCVNFTAASNCYTASTSGGGGGTVVFNLSGNSFVIGETYYVMIDGWLGDFCEYSIAVIEGMTSLPPINDPVAPSGMATVCPGATGITYSIPSVPDATGYNWTVPAGASFTENADGTSITVNFSNTAVSGDICVEAFNDCHQSNPMCFFVDLQALPPGYDFGEYCAGHTFYYPDNGTNYTQGTYFLTLPGASALGCDSTVILEVTENPIEETFIIETLCAGESYELGGIAYTATNHNIQTTFATQNNCDSTVYLDLTVLEPAAVIATPDQLGCNNSTVLLNAILSTADTYTWSTANGNIVTGQGTPLLTVDFPGIYELTVTQSYGGRTCSAYSSVEVFFDNDLPVLSVNTSDASCYGISDGTAAATISGGVGPFNYAWNNGDDTPTLAGLATGNYSLTITGANGCTATQSITINEPLELSLSTGTTDISCQGGNDGTATVSPSGGTPPYTYQWENGDNTATAISLAATTYELTVTDANNCTATTSVVIAEPQTINLSVSGIDAACENGTDGEATVVASGGTGNLSYTWNTTPVQTTATAGSLGAGDYEVTVSDENGCTATDMITITEPAGLNLQTNFNDPSCTTANDGSATVVVSGGSGGYTYQWGTSPVQTAATALDLPAGNYIVTVSDQNGCTATTSVSLIAPSDLNLTVSEQNVSCFGGVDGMAMVSVSGGTAPYTYLWDDGANQTSAQATGLVSGNYTVNCNGCK